MCLSADIRDHIETVVAAVRGIQSIWLIGSRANGTEKAGSDWDFLVMGDALVHRALQARPDLLRGDVDLLVLKDDGKFSVPWSATNPKSVSLSYWRVCEDREDIATYDETNFIENKDRSVELDADLGDFETKSKRAIRVWISSASSFDN